MPFAISPEFSVRGYDAGHIIGSSSLELTITEAGCNIIVVFSGDIGRYDQPILKNPQTPPRADYLLCESTYGDRDHPGGSPLDALGDVVSRVVKRGGVMVIPSFAVGRVQLLLYMLRELEDLKRIPRIPLYVDSPMAISATALYLSHREDHDAEFTREELSGDPLGMHGVHLTKTSEESRQINKVTSPCIILSASGMATGGRVLFHLARRLPDSRNAVILPGYQAEGTRGRQLADGARSINIHGAEVAVNAEVCVLPQFSAHAGQSEILRWLSGISAPPRQTFMVHGEPGPAAALRAKIEQQFHWNVVQPAYAQSFDLTV
jgi:metallo-beta-lactamase family protein